MTETGGNSFLKWLGIIALIVVGIIVVVYIGVPVLKLAVAAIWSLSGLVAFLLKIVLFVGLCIALILGLLMLISWLIKEFTE